MVELGIFLLVLGVIFLLIGVFLLGKKYGKREIFKSLCDHEISLVRNSKRKNSHPTRVEKISDIGPVRGYEKSAN